MKKEKKMKQKIIFAGPDCGNSHSKCAVIDKTGEIITKKIRSNVRCNPGSMEKFRSSYDPDIIEMEIEGEIYTIGNNISGMPTSSKAFSMGNTKLALIYGILAKTLGEEVKEDIKLIVPIPHRFYYLKNGQPNISNIREMQNLFRKNVTFLNKKYNINIVSTSFISEGNACLANLALDDPDFADKTTIVIDIGGYTTERIVYDGALKSIIYDEELTFSVNEGIKSIYPLLRIDYIKLVQEYSKNTLITPAINDNTIADSIETKKLDILGYSIPCEDIIEKRLKNLANKLYGIITTQIDDADNARTILFTGGGSVLLKKYISKWFSNPGRIKYKEEFETAISCARLAEEKYKSL